MADGLKSRELCPQGATIEVFDLDGIFGLDQDEERNPPQSVVELKRRIRDADAIVLATPEYNYGMPACSRTRSTGPRDPMATTRGTASRARS